MTNIKENKLDQIKQDLNDIKLNAESLDIKSENDDLSKEVNLDRLIYFDKQKNLLRH